MPRELTPAGPRDVVRYYDTGGDLTDPDLDGLARSGLSDDDLGKRVRELATRRRLEKQGVEPQTLGRYYRSKTLATKSLSLPRLAPAPPPRCPAAARAPRSRRARTCSARSPSGDDPDPSDEPDPPSLARPRRAVAGWSR
jgi:hypothetical protein